MLFLHGYPEFWYSWRFQLNEFQDRFRCVAIDQRGYNLSDKPKPTESYTMDELVGDVRDVIQSLGYQTAIVVAHDWGGLVAWEFAERYPEMVEKLICCNIPRPGAFANKLWGTWSQFKKSWYIFFYQNTILPELFCAAGDMIALDRVFRQEPMGIRNKQNFTDEDLEAWKYTLSHNGASFKYPINYYRSIFTHIHPGRQDLVLEMPVLIIWGTGDTALDYEAAEESLNTLRNGVIKRIAGASHWVQQDEPDLVNQYITEFLSLES
uniref:AB hydrolase-1 domain-containing protein n=1 Tax=Caenorhabditis japonica TaxID=281687 RepID=A0A8R1E3P2_CAEJA